MNNRFAILGNPSERTEPSVLQWLARSKFMAIGWTAMRIWLGIMWIQAGVAKLWGAENPSFLHNNDAGVAGFAAHGVPAYSWWAGFLHNFVIPNASWIAKIVSLGELLIGIGLIVGLFTGAAAFAGLLLNMTYMFSGSAGVNPAYTILAVLLILAWRNAGWIGLDRFVLRNSWTTHRTGALIERMTHRRIVALPASQ